MSHVDNSSSDPDQINLVLKDGEIKISKCTLQYFKVFAEMDDPSYKTLKSPNYY